MSIRVEKMGSIVAELGEGPCWVAKSGRLLWLDIKGPTIHEWDSVTGQIVSYKAPDLISAIVPCAAGGWLATAYHSLFYWEPEGNGLFQEVARLAHLQPEVRFNDAKAGPDGRLWAGTMSMDGTSGLGVLYAFESDYSWHEAITGVSVSNGLDWSPDGTIMYYVDSPTRIIQAFDYQDHGPLGRGRTAVAFGEEDLGIPDGLTVDALGNIWVAHWGGSCVSHWNPATGECLDKIIIPAPQPTSCVFGGPNRDELFITSAKEGMDSQAKADQPDAGALFRAVTNVQGKPGFSFGKK